MLSLNDDLNLFFDPAVFAIPATFLRGTTVLRTAQVIFTAGAQSVGVYDTTVEESAPTLQCKSADLTGVRRKDRVQVADGEFTIERIEPDGTGVSLVYLS